MMKYKAAYEMLMELISEFNLTDEQKEQLWTGLDEIFGADRRC